MRKHIYSAAVIASGALLKTLLTLQKNDLAHFHLRHLRNLLGCKARLCQCDNL